MVFLFTSLLEVLVLALHSDLRDGFARGCYEFVKATQEVQAELHHAIHDDDDNGPTPA